MADIAVLGFKADSAPLITAEQSLDKLSSAAKHTDAAVVSMGAGMQNAAVASQRATASTTGHSAAITGHTTKMVMNTTAVHANNAALQIHANNSKMAAFQQRNLVFQLNDVAVSLVSGMNPLMVAAQQGSQIATIYGPNEGGLGRAFKETGKMALGLITKFPLLTGATAVLGAGFSGMAYEMEKATGKSVTMGDVISATLVTIKDGIYNEIQPAIAAISPWFSSAYNFVADLTKDIGNFVIRSWVGAFETIKTLWSDFPNVIGDVIRIAAFRMMDGIAVMAQDAIRLINTVYEKASELSQSVGGPALNGRLDPQMIQLPDAPQLTSQGGIDLFDRLNEIDNTDYMGQFYNAIQNNVVKGLTEAGEAADQATKAINNVSNDNLEPISLLGKAIQKTQSVIEGYRGTFTGFFSELSQGLRSGEGVWKSFESAALNALNKILDKMMDFYSNQLFTALLGGIGGGAIRPVSTGTFGGLPPVYGNGTDYHPGGAAIVGDRGPEIVNLPRGSRVTPNHKLQGASNNTSGQIQIGVSVDDEGALQAYVKKQSFETSVGVVQNAAPAIANSGAGLAQKQFGSGQYNSAMSGLYGAKPAVRNIG